MLVLVICVTLTLAHLGSLGVSTILAVLHQLWFEGRISTAVYMRLKKKILKIVLPVDINPEDYPVSLSPE